MNATVTEPMKHKNESLISKMRCTPLAAMEVIVGGFIVLLVTISAYKAQAVSAETLRDQSTCVKQRATQHLAYGDVVKIHNLDDFESDCDLDRERHEKMVVVERQLKALR